MVPRKSKPSTKLLFWGNEGIFVQANGCKYVKSYLSRFTQGTWILFKNCCVHIMLVNPILQILILLIL